MVPILHGQHFDPLCEATVLLAKTEQGDQPADLARKNGHAIAAHLARMRS